MPDTTETIFNTQAAAEHLNKVISGDGVAYWEHVLRNNRRTDRKQAHKIPFFLMGKAAFYTLDAIAAFIEWEKMRRIGTMKLDSRAAEIMQAVGFGDPNGSTTGRKLVYSSATGQVAESDGAMFVQFTIGDPLRIYRLPLEQAEQIARDLADAVDFARDQHGRAQRAESASRREVAE